MSKTVTRMLLIDPQEQTLAEATVDALPRLLSERDLFVVNDAATLPASLAAVTARGEPVEIRLLEGPYGTHVRAVLFGAGDFHTPTELRPAPPALAIGAALYVAGRALAVAHVAACSPRLVVLRWPGSAAERFALLYAQGRPVQYSYVPKPLALWDVQTVFAARPWAVEMPSAARPLRASLLLALRAKGLRIASLTHAAGLSATGDAALDAMLPLPERYEIPAETVKQLQRTQREAGRVIAVGTSVVRALEDSAARHGTPRAGQATAQLVLGAHSEKRVVTGLLTGIHIPGESHYRLLESFVDGQTLARSVELAQRHGYRAHEFGDAALIVPGLALSKGLAA